MTFQPPTLEDQSRA